MPDPLPSAPPPAEPIRIPKTPSIPPDSQPVAPLEDPVPGGDVVDPGVGLPGVPGIEPGHPMVPSVM